MSYHKRRHVIFVTPKMQDYCRVTEGDPEFPPPVRTIEDGVFTFRPVTMDELLEWANKQKLVLDKRHGTTGFNFRTEEW